MSKRRLQLLVLQRNRMLKYMRRTDRPLYERVMEGLGLRPTYKFDPTVRTHQYASKPRDGKPARRGRRRKEPTPYGSAKTAKGRTRLRKHAARQRRLQKGRAAEAASVVEAERLAKREKEWAKLTEEANARRDAANAAMAGKGPGEE